MGRGRGEEGRKKRREGAQSPRCLDPQLTTRLSGSTCEPDLLEHSMFLVIGTLSPSFSTHSQVPPLMTPATHSLETCLQEER